MGLFGTVSSLFNSSMYVVVDNADAFAHEVEMLPTNIKKQLTMMLSKRGMLNDDNIKPHLHPDVRELDLSVCDVSDKSLEEISIRCPNLAKIDLDPSATEGQTRISSSGVGMLARGCNNLQVVYLGRCVNLTDSGCIDLAENCAFLKQLNLTGCAEVTDTGIHAISTHCGSLAHLNISGTSVTDGGIDDLVSSPCGNSLIELHINHCTKLTDAALESIARISTQLQILTFHSCPNMTVFAQGTAQPLQLNRNFRQLSWTIY